jgi:hypothetical protein
MKLEIEQILVASTGHITQEDAKWLDSLVTSSKPPMKVYDRPDSGWFVHVPTDMTDEDLAYFSTAFQKLIILAQQHNARWILLDTDGPLYADKQPCYNLEIHDW